MLSVFVRDIDWSYVCTVKMFFLSVSFNKFDYDNLGVVSFVFLVCVAYTFLGFCDFIVVIKFGKFWPYFFKYFFLSTGPLSFSGIPVTHMLGPLKLFHTSLMFYTFFYRLFFSLHFIWGGFYRYVKFISLRFYSV